MPDNPLTLLHSDPASRPAPDVLQDLGVVREEGLEPAEIRQRLFAQLWLVLSLRASRVWIEDEVVRNPYVWAALLLCAILLAGVVYAPGFAALLELESLGLAGWALVLGLSPLPLLIGGVYRRVRRATV